MRSVGLRVSIWEMGRGRMHFNLSTGSFLETLVVFQLIQIPTCLGSYNFNASFAVISARSNLLMKRIWGSRKNLYKSRKPWGEVRWQFTEWMGTSIHCTALCLLGLYVHIILTSNGKVSSSWVAQSGFLAVMLKMVLAVKFSSHLLACS